MATENQQTRDDAAELPFDPEIHMNYDEDDLRAIEAEAPRLQFNQDNSIFFARQLDYVKARAYNRKYVELKGNLLVPVATDVPEWAETVSVKSWDTVGIAKIISNYADDLPRADVRAVERAVRVQTLGDSYGYNVNELRASQAAGTGLDVSKGLAARRAIEQKLNRIVLRGDTDFGMFGLLNHPNVALVTRTGTAWTLGTTTGDMILADLNALYTAIINQSNGLHEPNFLALPPTQRAIASSRVVSGTMGVTALEFFLRQHPNIRVEGVYEMKGAGTGATDVAFMYERTEENLWHDLVMPFRQLPPQARNLEFVIPCMARSAGVSVQYPLGFAKMEGI